MQYRACKIESNTMQWLQHALHCYARNTVQCSTVQSDPVQCVQHSRCGAVQWSPIQCSAVRVTQWSGKHWSIAQCSVALLLSLAQFSSPRPALFSSDPHGDLLFPFSGSRQCSLLFYCPATTPVISSSLKVFQSHRLDALVDSSMLSFCWSHFGTPQ